MRVFEVFKPALNGRIEVGYDVLDAVASCPASLSADLILDSFETL